MLHDLTTGKPGKVIFFFSMPMLLSSIFQQFYNIMDSVIAGKYAGVDALAAVGASYPVTMIFIAVALGCAMGSTVVVSSIFGAKDMKRLKCAIFTTLIYFAAISVLLTGIGIYASRPVLSLLDTPQNIFESSLSYLKIYIYGLFFLFMYNAATSIFTALGNSKTPLYFLIFSSVLNIILDLLFVAKFKMGVNGVAYATLIAQGVSAVIAVIHLLCEVKKINSNGKYQIFSLQEFKKMSLIAIPSILQQSFLSVGQLCVQGLINSYGSDVVAGYSAAIKINTFMTTVETSFGNALSSYTSQNYGAGKYDRVKAGHISGLKILVTIAIVIPAFIFVFAPQLIELFVNADEGMNVINVGSGFLRVLAPFYFVVAIKLVTDGVLRGLGKMREFMIATFCDLILRVGGSFLLSMPVFGLKYLGIWWAYPLGWTIATILSVVLCLNVYKKTFNGENQ